MFIHIYCQWCVLLIGCGNLTSIIIKLHEYILQDIKKYYCSNDEKYNSIILRRIVLPSLQFSWRIICHQTLCIFFLEILNQIFLGFWHLIAVDDSWTLSWKQFIRCIIVFILECVKQGTDHVRPQDDNYHY